MPEFAKALRQLRDRDRQPYLTGISPVASVSLSTQLEYLKSRVLTYTPVEAKPRQLLPPGEVQSSRYGSHYVVRKTYTDGYEHGKIRLSRFSTTDLQRLLQLRSEERRVGE